MDVQFLYGKKTLLLKAQPSLVQDLLESGDRAGPYTMQLEQLVFPPRRKLRQRPDALGLECSTCRRTDSRQPVCRRLAPSLADGTRWAVARLIELVALRAGA